MRNKTAGVDIFPIAESLVVLYNQSNADAAKRHHLTRTPFPASSELLLDTLSALPSNKQTEEEISISHTFKRQSGVCFTHVIIQEIKEWAVTSIQVSCHK